jgi:hypothetical protein
MNVSSVFHAKNHKLKFRSRYEETYETLRTLKSGTSSSSSIKELFFSLSLPQKILPDCARISLFFNFATITLQRKVVSLAPKTQPGPCIHVPQWQGGPVTPPGSGYLIYCFLRLSGLHTGSARVQILDYQKLCSVDRKEMYSVYTLNRSKRVYRLSFTKSEGHLE